MPILFPFLVAHQADKVRPLEIVPMLVAKARINELLRKDLDFEQVLATVQAAAELEIDDVGVIVAKYDVLRIDVLDILFLLLPVLDITVLVAILGDRMSPEFFSAARFLANLELDAFLLFILR